jgi:hypothetical protein
MNGLLPFYGAVGVDDNDLPRVGRFVLLEKQEKLGK